MGRSRSLAMLACLAASALCAVLLFKHISYPLLWNDEAATAMFGRRVLEHGYPVVHGPKNTLFFLWQRDGTGLHEASDAYTGSPWLQYYVAALGVALGADVDDLYRRTAWVRLPFALLGFLGLVVLAAAVAPAIDRSRGRRWIFAALLFLLFSYSVSLLLHLREARHPPLAVLGVATSLWIYLRRQVFGRSSRRVYTAALALSLFALFHAFYPMSVMLGIAMGLHLTGRALWRRRPAGELARDLLPLAIAALVTAPLLLFFDFLDQTRAWVRLSGDSRYPGNLGAMVAHLLRYELLAPALALRLAVAVLCPAAPAEIRPELRQRLEIVHFLWLLIATCVLLMPMTPMLFQRYYVALGPVISTLLLLDAFSVAELVRRPLPGPRLHLGRAAAAAAALAFGVSTAVRLPEFRGRVYEITHRYRGPMDFVIPYLAEKYPSPEELVIATNFEGTPFMFYLDARVTVAPLGVNLERDREIQPDVIVPRPWLDYVDVLQELAERAPYEVHSFPVMNLWWNNVPTLGARGGRESHQFETRIATGDEPRLEILERRAPAP